MPPRTILHVDMDAFFASVEQRDTPAWRGQPVIVGSPPNRRGVVCAASYEARRFGVRSAMPSRTAGRLCPHGIFVPPRMDAYKEESRRIFEILRQHAPVVEPLSIDEAFLDATGFPDGPAVARAVKAAIRDQTQLAATVGVAPNKFLAKLASDTHKPDGLGLVTEDAKLAFLDPLPVESLWGVGCRTADSLHRAGIHTIGDLHRYEGNLTAVVGAAHGLWLKRLAAGEDDRPVSPDDERKSVSAEETFSQDTRSTRLIRQTLLQQAEEVAAALRRHHLVARTIQLKLRWSDFTTLTRQHTLAQPTDDELLLFRTAWTLAERLRGQGRAVRLVGLGAHNLARPDPQLDLFSNLDPRRARLTRAADEIRAQFGSSAIHRIT